MSSSDWVENVFLFSVCEREKGSSTVFETKDEAVDHFENQHLHELQERRGVVL